MLYSFIHLPGSWGVYPSESGPIRTPNRVAKPAESCPPEPHFLGQLFALFLVNFLGKKSAPDRGRSGGVGTPQTTLPGPHREGLGRAARSSSEGPCVTQLDSVPYLNEVPSQSVPGPLRTPPGPLREDPPSLKAGLGGWVWPLGPLLGPQVPPTPTRRMTRVAPESVSPWRDRSPSRT